MGIKIPELKELRENFDSSDSIGDGPAFYRCGFLDALQMVVDHSSLFSFDQLIDDIKKEIENRRNNHVR